MAVLCILLAVGVLLPRKPVAVATLHDTYNAQWAANQTSRLKGQSLLDDNKPVHLVRGLAEINFDSGVTLVAEGPVEFRVAGMDRISLSYGRLCARVPPFAHGFRVDTPQCDVIDLGTEFGLDVDITGTTRVQMYTGKASLVPSHQVGTPTPEQLLEEGQARAVDSQGSIQSVTLDTTRLVRQFSSQSGILWRGESLYLHDLITGGNGLGPGRYQWGIDAVTGKIKKIPTTLEGYRNRSGFIDVNSTPYIDGIFVPNKQPGPCRVTSAGHIFTDCPPTNGNVHLGLWDNTGDIIDDVAKPMDVKSVFMHANVGVTLDLQQIRSFVRRLHHQMQVTHLHARVGYRSNTLKAVANNRSSIIPTADIWVLVDGQTQFSHIGLRADGEAISFDVELETGARFLSLAVTEGAEGANSNDWVEIRDAQLEISY